MFTRSPSCRLAALTLGTTLIAIASALALVGNAHGALTTEPEGCGNDPAACAVVVGATPSSAIASSMALPAQRDFSKPEDFECKGRPGLQDDQGAKTSADELETLSVQELTAWADAAQRAGRIEAAQALLDRAVRAAQYKAEHDKREWVASVRQAAHLASARATLALIQGDRVRAEQHMRRAFELCDSL